ncbi:hypothetical protein M409DRAFT_71606 [Zasmidium cellare ATCC 36951]|uniref:Major facilitator superfamily (MFS) profile domain-containing protein n=1 Tax=Zasmidium cellare ATCC 36951 TaxID=1080233 RepID=A0A6A6BUZ8_ZASCE|nr:uncharacterized protein M409DRAFT_71606 [Zasmidium cellare ATCC 36951]KAF2158515.1 hypothetical protein M409DRAFT_71606 [Zasmidium cellare ATCC 36951]
MAVPTVQSEDPHVGFAASRDSLNTIDTTDEQTIGHLCQSLRQGSDHAHVGDASYELEASSEHLTTRLEAAHTSGRYLTGWRLYVAGIGLGLSVFLPALEVSVISTSLISISNDLDGFEQSSWIITAYLLTYTGGAGLYAVGTIEFIQMVPASRYKEITSIASSIMSLGMILGPLVGGGINETDPDNWRWVFYLNLPAGVVALLIIIASILLLAALQEGNVRFPWESAAIISFFVISGLLWIAFLLWERFASRPSSRLQPMFPWHFFSNRIWMGVLLGCLLSGAPLTIAVTELPQRYQIVNASSSLHAGIRLLPYAVTSPVGIVMSTVLIGKLRIPFMFVLLLGIVLQTAGFALLSTVPNTLAVWAGQYGYSVVAGLGTGASIGSLYMMAPIVVDKDDQALAIGSTLQLRMLGGAVRVAVANSVLNSHVRSHLPGVLSGEQLASVLESARGIINLPLDTQLRVREIYGEAYNLQMRVTVGFSAAHILAVLLMWKNRPLRLSKEGALV